jgi:hypothetical protein
VNSTDRKVIEQAVATLTDYNSTDDNLDEIRDELKALLQPKPRAQRSMTEQMKDLIPVAESEGLYDAADFLRSFVKDKESW